jgi:DNA-binding transcriptional regulator LsrR (DeoR family)
MSNPLKQTVKDIQYHTDLTLDEIADKIEVSRAYFRNEVSKGTSGSILKKLQAKFNEIIEQNVSNGNRSTNHVNDPGAPYGIKNPGEPGQTLESLLKNQLKDKEEIIKLLKERDNMQKQLGDLQAKVSELTETVNENNGYLKKLGHALDQAFPVQDHHRKRAKQ